ncbi:MAG: hypothetical protein QXO80_03705 [Thermosphaera sp.]
MEKPIKIYRNEDVEKVIACIPSGHVHTRFVIGLKDQVIILQEAVVAALLRAYASTAIHPTRKSIILVSKTLPDVKKGFAKSQLIESEMQDGCEDFIKSR